MMYNFMTIITKPINRLLYEFQDLHKATNKINFWYGKSLRWFDKKLDYF